MILLVLDIFVQKMRQQFRCTTNSEEKIDFSFSHLYQPGLVSLFVQDRYLPGPFMESLNSSHTHNFEEAHFCRRKISKERKL